MDIAAKLRIPKDKKIVLINHDDLGMNYGSNEAFQKIVESGTFNSSSIMSPCPWFPHAVETYAQNPQMNVGIHLTLTSEWKGYKWKPLSTVNQNSGLIDPDGYFWPKRQMLQEKVVREAAELEFRTQIEKVINSGIDITHIDCHMGVGFIPELFEIYVGLGKKYSVPVLVPTNITDMLNLYKIEDTQLDYYNEIIKNLKNEGFPLFDHFLITPCFEKGTALTGYKNMLINLKEGVTVTSLHPNTINQIKEIDPALYYVRVEEYEVFSKQIEKSWLEANNIQIINYRDILNHLPKK